MDQGRPCWREVHLSKTKRVMTETKKRAGKETISLENCKKMVMSPGMKRMRFGRFGKRLGRRLEKFVRHWRPSGCFVEKAQGSTAHFKEKENSKKMSHMRGVTGMEMQ